MRFQKPTPEEVTRYAYKIGFILNGNEFCDYYESKGWVVGKSPMKVWQAAVRTWKAKESRWDKKIDPKAIQAVPDANKQAEAKRKMEDRREREWDRREAARRAQERDDLRTKKMAESYGEKESEFVPVAQVLAVVKGTADKWIEEDLRIHSAD